MANGKCARCKTPLKKGIFYVQLEWPSGRLIGTRRNTEITWCPKCDSTPEDGGTWVGIDI